MPVTVGSMIDRHKDSIQELISNSIMDMSAALDPMHLGMITTSQGVTVPDTMSRDLKVRKLFSTGVSGVIQAANALNPIGETALYGDATEAISDRLYKMTTFNSYPSARDGARQRRFRMDCSIKAKSTNLELTIDDYNLEALPATIGDIVRPIIIGFGRNVAQTRINSFWINGDNLYKLCSLGTVGSPVDRGDGYYTLEFTVPDFMVGRFQPGMLVDIHAPASGTANLNYKRRNDNAGTHIPVWVDAVDGLTGPKIRLVSKWDFTGVVSGDGLHPYKSITGNATAGAAGYEFSGLYDWMKFGTGGNDNYLQGAGRDSTNFIDVTVHPEFKSLRYELNQGGAAQALTVRTLRAVINRWKAEKTRYGQDVDTMLSSEGVWEAYEAQQAGELIRDGDRVRALANEGWAGGITFVHEGKTFKGHTIPVMSANRVVMHKLGGGNWKVYVPPFAGKDNIEGDQTGTPFEFLGNQTPYQSGIWFPIFDTSGSENRLTRAMQAPGDVRMDVIPDQPAGIEISNVAEERIYSN